MAEQSAEDITADTLAALLGELSQEGRALLGEGASDAADPLAGITDLEQHRARIEVDIRATENALLVDSNNGVVEYAAVHALLRKAEGTLAVVQTTLDSYQSALGLIASQIEALRAQSGDISVHLRNRREAAARLDAALSALVIPPKLVRAITEGDINGEYCAHLDELSRLLSPPDGLEKSTAYGDVCGVTALLCSLSAMRVRDFLYQQLFALTRPGTNVQIIQQSILDKHAPLNHFLIAHAPHFAAEIRDNYVSTLFLSGIHKLSCLFLSPPPHRLRQWDRSCIVTFLFIYQRCLHSAWGSAHAKR